MRGGGVASAKPKYPPDASGGNNEICEKGFELSCAQIKMHGSGTTDMKPVYPSLLSADIMNKLR